MKSTKPSQEKHFSPTEIWLAMAFGSFFFFLYCFFSTGRIRTRDEFLTALQTESLVLTGKTAVPQALQSPFFYGIFDRFGEPQAPYPPGQAVASLPFYLLGRTLSKEISSIPVSSRRIVCDFAQVLSNALFAAVTSSLLLFVFLDIGLQLGTALAASVIAALATPLASYSGWFYSEPLASALALGAAALLLTSEDPGGVGNPKAWFGASLLGLMSWVRATHVIAVPIFLLAVLVQHGRKGIRLATIVAVVVSCFVLVLLWRNYRLYLNPFEFGYPKTDGGNSFQGDFFHGLAGFLLSPGKSLFVFSPTIFLSFIGLRALWGANKGLAVLAGAFPIVYLLFFSKFMQWEGGYCYGPRYLVPALVVASLALGPYLSRGSARRRIAAAILSGIGFLVQTLGLAVNYLEAEFAGGYYDQSHNYQLWFWGPFAQAKLLCHYISNHVEPALGSGFDRWWMFLTSAGVPPFVVRCFGFVMLAGMALTAWLLSMALDRSAREIERGERVRS